MLSYHYICVCRTLWYVYTPTPSASCSWWHFANRVLAELSGTCSAAKKVHWLVLLCRKMLLQYYCDSSCFATLCLVALVKCQCTLANAHANQRRKFLQILTILYATIPVTVFWRFGWLLSRLYTISIGMYFWRATVIAGPLDHTESRAALLNNEDWLNRAPVEGPTRSYNSVRLYRSFAKFQSVNVTSKGTRSIWHSVLDRVRLPHTYSTADAATARLVLLRFRSPNLPPLRSPISNLNASIDIYV